MPAAHIAIAVVHFGAALGGSVASAAAEPGPAPACEVRGSQRWLSTRASPLDSATVTVGGAIAKVCYSRPRLRGRSLDSLLPPRRAWRTGANEPTTITLTGRLSVGGAVLEPGRYIVLTVPDAERWTLIFHTTSETEPAKVFTTMTPVAQGVGSVERVPDVVEQFTIRSAAEGSDAALLLEWGQRRIRVPVRAAP